MKRTYKVGTFPGIRPGCRPVAYTLWFNEEWTGCKVYVIEAESGKEAKQIAIRMRMEEEG